jgi:hypothetical protein
MMGLTVLLIYFAAEISRKPLQKITKTLQISRLRWYTEAMIERVYAVLQHNPVKAAEGDQKGYSDDGFALHLGTGDR